MSDICTEIGDLPTKISLLSSVERNKMKSKRLKRQQLSFPSYLSSRVALPVTKQPESKTENSKG